MNTFASEEERHRVESAYARNEPLMARLRPLGERKAEFREDLTETLTKYRADLSRGAVLRVAGARFFVVDVSHDERGIPIPTFESADGQRFAIAAAGGRAEADGLVARAGPDSVILEIQPQWSFPDEAWMAADPDFWSASARVRERDASPI